MLQSVDRLRERDPVTTLTLANASLVTPTEVMTGRLTFDNGVIAEIAAGDEVPAGAVDCGGDYVSPGLIELHTDNLERHMKPRPGVRQAHADAVLAHDGELASTGITTVFDALRIGSVVSDSRTGYQPYAREAADAIDHLAGTDSLRISHLVHLRAEVCSETLAEELESFRGEPRVRIVSLMDHSPGQRQFRNVAQLEQYLRGKHNMSDDAIADHFTRMKQLRERVSDAHRELALSFARDAGAVIASHDDTTAEDVDMAVVAQSRLAEFPTTVEAAELCAKHNIAVMMGAPNLMRGSSHSGNVSALDLVGPGLLHILSSDYVPSTLLRAAVKLGGIVGDMAAGMATVTSAPAKAADLTDRGILAVGMRADLLRFRVTDDRPRVRGVWSGGCQVA